MMGTVDNRGYYSRINVTDKVGIIQALIKDMKAKTVCDYGCNTGLMSKGMGLEVNAYDLLEGIPSQPLIGWHYHFEDVTKLKHFKKCDVVLFLSLFHHLLAVDKTKAYELFYKLLLSCKYLIFDCGNLSEPGSAWTTWYQYQKTLFGNEKELMDSFGVPYMVYGNWKICGGQRTIVVFKSEDLKFRVLEKLQRFYVDNIMRLVKYGSMRKVELGVMFHKLMLPNGTTLFAKLRSAEYKGREAKELQNIEKVYNFNQLPFNLIDYYGFSEEYGTLFKWMDFEKVARATAIPQIQTFFESNFGLIDCDVMFCKDKKFVFDFER